MTTLYILTPIHISGDDPWSPWYDKCFGFVIRAKDEAEARHIAEQNAGDENRGEFLSQKISNTTSPWLDEKYSKCLVLSESGDVGLVMRDFASA